MDKRKALESQRENLEQDARGGTAELQRAFPDFIVKLDLMIGAKLSISWKLGKFEIEDDRVIWNPYWAISSSFPSITATFFTDRGDTKKYVAENLDELIKLMIAHDVMDS